MKYGGWIPISKGFIRHLPKDRPYTKLEAVFSLQCDFDEKKKVTLRGYATLWKWSFGKVYRFFEELGIKIEYPENTSDRQNQRGTIMNTITERSQQKYGTIRLIDYNSLESITERNEKENGTKTERSAKPTNILYPNPKKTPADFLKRYADQDLIERAFQAIRSTRKTGKISDSVLLSQLKGWERYPVEHVEAAINTYLSKDYASQGKDEKYLAGILRNQKTAVCLTNEYEPKQMDLSAIYE